MVSGGEVAKGQLVTQQVATVNTVHAPTLCADIQVPVEALHDIHRSTAAQTLGTVGLTLMQTKVHLVGIALKFRDDESFCGSCHQHLFVLKK